MGTGRVGDPVAGVDDRVESGVHPKRLPGEADVVVDRSWDPHHRDTVPGGQQMGPLQRTVSADHNQAREGVLLHGAGRLRPTLTGVEAGAAGSAEHGATQPSRMLDIGKGADGAALSHPTRQRAKRPVDEPIESVPYPPHHHVL